MIPVQDFSQKSFNIFNASTEAYHIRDDVDAPHHNPYEEGSIEHTLFEKNYIDAVQWHLEDIIRDPEIDPAEALKLKRRIDSSNQDRTDMVEQLDTYFLNLFRNVKPLEGATINTESPAWALDRLSILALKIYHMEQEIVRADATPEHIRKCSGKLNVLQEQRKDLIEAIQTLLDDILSGKKHMKVYRQMKMYNDTDTNPILYAQRNKQENL